MQIKLINDTPIMSRPYRMTENEKDIVRKTTAELLSLRAIRESTSPYVSPVLLVDEKTGVIRTTRTPFNIRMAV